MAGGRQPGDIDDVLDADRNAMQRSAWAPRRDLGLGGARRRHGSVGIEPNEDVELRIEPLDAIQQGLRQFNRREFASGDCPRCLGGREPVECRSSPGSGSDATGASPGGG